MVNVKTRKCRKRFHIKNKYKKYEKKRGIWAAYIKQTKDIKKKKTLRRRRVKSLKK